VGRRSEDDERYYTQLDPAWLDGLGERLLGAEPEAIEEALDFLERDPYFFRSGYLRERIARRLARVDLAPPQKDRARAIVLSTVDGHRHCPHPGVGRLARAVADNTLRRELRTRLHHHDDLVAWRALRVIANVRHPGLTPDDMASARSVALTAAGRGQWLSPTVARLATYLWSSEWRAELRSLLPHHGPDRAAAKRLVQEADRRRSRRPGP
jgi:hypothetical protein